MSTTTFIVGMFCVSLIVTTIANVLFCKKRSRFQVFSLCMLFFTAIMAVLTETISNVLCRTGDSGMVDLQTVLYDVQLLAFFLFIASSYLVLVSRLQYDRFQYLIAFVEGFACTGKLALLIVNRFNNSIFWVSDDLTLQRGPLYLFVHVLCLLETLYFTFFSYYYRRELGDYPFHVACYLEGTFILDLLVIICTPRGNYLYTTALGILICHVSISRRIYKEFRSRRKELRYLESTKHLSKLNPEEIRESMDGIAGLCLTDSEEASETIDLFADFIRKSMDDVRRVVSKSFKEEMAYLDKYIELQQHLFRFSIPIEYYFERKEFYLPSLILQQTVETFFNYCKSYEEFGHLEVHTYDQNSRCELEIRLVTDLSALHKKYKEMAVDMDYIFTRVSALPDVLYDMNQKEKEWIAVNYSFKITDNAEGV